MRQEPVSQPKHPVWVWKRSVWITYHLNIWNGSKAGDKNVSFDLCNWTYGTRIISSSLIHITATFLNQRSRKQELEIYNSCETYMLKNDWENINTIFNHALIDLALFSDKITNIIEYLDITGDKWSARNYKKRTWPSVTQTVDLISNRLLRVKCVKYMSYLQSQVEVCCHIRPAIYPIYGWCYPNRCCFRCADYPKHCWHCN